MKKLILFILIILGFYIYFNEISYSPLKESNFKNLFTNNQIDYKKIYSKNFIGFSFHKELFEIYVYKMNNAILNKNNLKFDRWEGSYILKEDNIYTWRKCPIDIITSNKIGDIIGFDSFKENKYGYYFIKHLNNPNNYYIYVC